MPIRLWTGLPGSGKTAQMIAELLKFKEQNPDRPVFAINVESLSEEVATQITRDQLYTWWDSFPPNSIILIDECNEPDFFPLDRGVPDEWIAKLVKNRREGMDFWITTVHPTLFSAYVRKLVDFHTHCVRKFNTKVVQRFTWGRCMEACEKGGAQKAATVSVGTLPSHVFHLYKSANAHNMKRRVPAKVWMLVFFVLLAIGGAFAAPWLIKRAHEKNIEGITGKKIDGTDAVKKADEQLRQKDYVKWTEPRVPGIPWTAPAYDGESVKSEPRIFCIAWEDGKTNCITEQGTKIEVPAKIARLIAKNGVYDPFLAPKSTGQEEKKEEAPPVQPQARTAPALPDQVTGEDGRRESKLRQAYVPPEQQQSLQTSDGYVKMQ